MVYKLCFDRINGKQQTREQALHEESQNRISERNPDLKFYGTFENPNGTDSG